jgi:hypothetical protein
MADHFDRFPKGDDGYRIVNAGGQEISEIIPNIDIFIMIIATTGIDSMVNVWVTFSGIGPDSYMTKPGYRPKIDKNTPRQTLLMLWKRRILNTEEDWRTNLEELCDEEEYKWEDQFEAEANQPRIERQQVHFNLKPWTKEN